jgi:hypothetical protein
MLPSEDDLFCSRNYFDMGTIFTAPRSCQPAVARFRTQVERDGRVQVGDLPGPLVLAQAHGEPEPQAERAGRAHPAQGVRERDVPADENVEIGDLVVERLVAEPGQPNPDAVRRRHVDHSPAADIGPLPRAGAQRRREVEHHQVRRVARHDPLRVLGPVPGRHVLEQLADPVLVVGHRVLCFLFGGGRSARAPLTVQTDASGGSNRPAVSGSGKGAGVVHG